MMSAKDVDKFLPEGRVEVPVQMGAGPDLGSKETKLAYVDTLAMQSKLGTKNRMRESSMTMRDSDIVRPRPVAAMAFASGPTVQIAPDSLHKISTPGMLREKVAESDSARAGEVTIVLPPTPGQQEAQTAREKLKKIQERITYPVPGPLATKKQEEPAPVKDLAPVQEEAKVEKKPEPVLVEVIPHVDAARLRELEDENRVLMNIVAKLAAENQALKARKA